MKAKVRLTSSKKVKNPFAAVLKTPDVKRQILATIPAFSASRPPSALKHNIAAHDTESVHSSDSNKFKVKFRLPGRAEDKGKELLKDVPESPMKLATETPEKKIIEPSEMAIDETPEKVIAEPPKKGVRRSSRRSATPSKPLLPCRADVAESPGNLAIQTPEKTPVETAQIVVRRSSRRSVTPQRFDPTVTVTQRRKKPATKVTIKRSKPEKIPE